MTVSTNSCPYCNSTDIAIDVPITVGCHLENGMLMLDDDYFDSSASQLAKDLEDANLDDMKGFCHHCGNHFDIESVDETGFRFRPQKKDACNL